MLRLFRMLGLAALLACGIPAQERTYQDSPSRDPQGFERSFLPRYIEGRFLLPNGEPPRLPVSFFVTNRSRTREQMLASDSKGHFFLGELSGDEEFTMVVPGDGVSYSTTIVAFDHRDLGTMQVRLRPAAGSGFNAQVVSAASLYQPDAKLVKLRDAALRMLGENNPGGAERALRKVTERDPRFASAFADLGALHIRQRRFEEAEAVLRQGLEADAQSDRLLTYLGLALSSQNRYQEAIDPLRRALRLNPAQVQGHLCLGIALLESGLYGEAEQEISIVLADPGPFAAQAYLALGKLLGLRKEYGKASEAFRQFLRLAPNAPTAPLVRNLLNAMESELASASAAKP